MPPADSQLRPLRLAAVLLVLAALAGCAEVEYARQGQSVEPRPGRSLVFARLRFFADGTEYFPWNPFDLYARERHVRLLRLDRVAAAGELWPDDDGTLAIWIPPGDYALLGTEADARDYPPSFEVLALLRVPAGAAAVYAGDFMSETTTPRPEEGWVVSFSRFGATRVQTEPVDEVRAALERKLGASPADPVTSTWCVRTDLPGFSDPTLRARARELLDRGCPPGSVER